MSFSSSFTEFTHQAATSIAGSGVALPNFLLREVGLTKGQMLVSMVSFSCLLAAIAIKYNMKNPLVTVAVVGAVALTAVGIECNVSLSSDVYDLGHVLLKPLRVWGDQNPHVNTLFASANSVLCLAIGLYSLLSSVMYGRRNCLAKGSVAIFLRMAIGLVTRLPEPSNVVFLDGDWPPSNDSCTGFIFNPSGHVLAAALVGMDLRRQKLHSYAFIVDLLNFLQATRLISLQGHYTVDVITSVLIAMVVDTRVEEMLVRADADARAAKAKTE
jgi:hypothetical protein